MWYRDDHTQVHILVTGGATEGALGLVALTVAPFADGPGPHRHPHHLEGCMVVAGLLAISHGAETSVLSAGQFQLLPRGQAHTYWNPGAEPARLLLFFTPGASAELLHQLAEGEPGSALPGWDTS
jgi:quercetin dioxygenase-like cupin family protein